MPNRALKMNLNSRALGMKTFKNRSISSVKKSLLTLMTLKRGSILYKQLLLSPSSQSLLFMPLVTWRRPQHQLWTPHNPPSSTLIQPCTRRPTTTNNPRWSHRVYLAGWSSRCSSLSSRCGPSSKGSATTRISNWCRPGPTRYRGSLLQLRRLGIRIRIRISTLMNRSIKSRKYYNNPRRDRHQQGLEQKVLALFTATQQSSL